MPDSVLKLIMVRPKLSVGFKTWFAFTIVFWVPFSLLLVILYSLLQQLVQEQTEEKLDVYLKGAKGIFSERLNNLSSSLQQISYQEDVQVAFTTQDKKALQPEGFLL